MDMINGKNQIKTFVENGECEEAVVVNGSRKVAWKKREKNERV